MVKRIENDNATSFVIKTREARQWLNPGRMGTPNLEGAAALRDFAAVLREYGMEVELREERTEAVMVVKHPNRWDAGRLRNRGGGKTETRIDPSSPLAGLTTEERLEWLEGHDEAEGCAALGTRDDDGNVKPASRATYYRRLKKLREQQVATTRREAAEAEARLLEAECIDTGE